MTTPPRRVLSGLFRMRGRKASVVLLQWANWLLLGLAWGMSVQAYLRLTGRMASWTSAWLDVPVLVDKSWLFFAYPLIQAVVVLAGRVLSMRYFVGRAGTADLADLRAEAAFLELIFVNVLFIHLQTVITLRSFGAAAGLNRFYMAVAAAVIVLIVPYYHIRRRILTR